MRVQLFCLFFLSVGFYSCSSHRYIKQYKTDSYTTDTTFKFKRDTTRPLLNINHGFVFTDSSLRIIGRRETDDSDDGDPISLADSIIESYGFKHIRVDECIASGRKPNFLLKYTDTWKTVDYIIGIEGEQRENWIQIFTEIGIIKERLDKYFWLRGFNCIPVLGISPKPVSKINSPGIKTIQEFQLKSTELKTLIKKYFEDYFKGKGNVSIKSENEQSYVFEVSKLSGEVIIDSKYWEQIILTIQVGLNEEKGNKAEVTLTFEGYYQAHTGDTPSYDESMEKKKFSFLFNYATKIRNQLNTYINEKKDFR